MVVKLGQLNVLFRLGETMSRDRTDMSSKQICFHLYASGHQFTNACWLSHRDPDY